MRSDSLLRTRSSTGWMIMVVLSGGRSCFFQRRHLAFRVFVVHEFLLRLEIGDTPDFCRSQGKTHILTHVWLINTLLPGKRLIMAAPPYGVTE